MIRPKAVLYSATEMPCASAAGLLAPVGACEPKIDQEEIEEGLSCIAAPIKNHRGKVIAGISVSGPIGRMRMEMLGDLKKDVIDKAMQISRRLGYKE